MGGGGNGEGGDGITLGGSDGGDVERGEMELYWGGWVCEKRGLGAAGMQDDTYMYTNKYIFIHS